MNETRRRLGVMLDLSWPFARHTGIFVGSQLYAQEKGWESTINERIEDTLAQAPEDTVPYDGILARVTPALYAQATRLNIPIINTWFSSPVWDKLPTIGPDFRAIGTLRAKHLLARGFRAFALLGCDNNRGHDLDCEGFLATLDDAGYSCLCESVPLEPATSVINWRRTEQTMASWMEGWTLPIGVCCLSDLHGRMIAQLCRNRGWRIPEDVAIIAGANEETYCEHLPPTLTSVDFGYERVGYEAAQLLDRMMSGDLVPTDPIFLPPEGLVARASTDFFAVDDPMVSSALEYISAHCHRALRQADIAKGIGVALKTLQRRFRTHLGRGIAAEIRRVRLERAKRELSQTDRSITQIAQAVGFGPRRRLYEVFLREVGITPTDYRKQRQLERDLSGSEAHN